MPKRKKNLSSSRSYISLLYGALAVIIVFVIIFFGLKAISHRSGTVGENGLQTSENTPKTYVVKNGDSLWSIALANYNDGYKWTEIAKANKLANPDQIDSGTKLTLPVISVQTTIAQEALVTENKITNSSYVVVEDDNLWTIAVRAYGDGFKWTEIARTNNIPNPDLIYPGNTLTLPR